MPQAIVTTFHGPTNRRPARITARVEAGSVTLSCDLSLNADGNHDAACVALLRKMGWKGTWSRGWLDNRRAVYVATDHPMTKTVFWAEDK